jgi:ketosteroid isomerase-like protein
MGKAEDEAEIRRIHRQWWTANHGLDIPKMRECFAPEYLMWNLNSHPYYGLAEKVKLWEAYRKEIAIPQPVEVWDVRVTVEGDMGYVTCEGVLPIAARTQAGTGAEYLATKGVGETVPFRFRETSVYRRDDGRGNKVWKMWHFHCSPLAPEDEPRPPVWAFGDTARERRPRLGKSEIMG